MANFKTSFAAARKAGKKVFTWNGKSYNTKLASDKPKAKAKAKASPKVDTAKVAAATKKAQTAAKKGRNAAKLAQDTKTATSTAPKKSKRPVKSSRKPKQGPPTVIDAVRAKTKTKGSTFKRLGKALFGRAKKTVAKGNAENNGRKVAYKAKKSVPKRGAMTTAERNVMVRKSKQLANKK